MAHQREREMYPAVRAWLERFLSDRSRGATVRVLDGSRRTLSRLIDQEGLAQNLPPEWPSWDIKVDVVGFAVAGDTTTLAFVECKPNTISLRDLSQLLGYSRVARPEYSFIVARNGPSDALRSLLVVFNRLDVLEYDREPGHLPRCIVVARWDESAACIDAGSVITGDRDRLGHL